MINFIKKIIILLCVLYSVGRIYFFIWAKSFRVLSVIQAANAANLEPIDITIVRWTVYIILAVIAVALVTFMIWLFTPSKSKKQQHEE